MLKLERAHSEESASPRKPKVWSDERSSYEVSFEV